MEEIVTPFDLSDIQLALNKVEDENQAEQEESDNEPTPQPSDSSDDEIVMQYIPPKKRKTGQQLMSDFFSSS